MCDERTKILTQFTTSTKRWVRGGTNSLWLWINNPFFFCFFISGKIQKKSSSSSRKQTQTFCSVKPTNFLWKRSFHRCRTDERHHKPPRPKTGTEPRSFSTESLRLQAASGGKNSSEIKVGKSETWIYNLSLKSKNSETKKFTPDWV